MLRARLCTPFTSSRSQLMCFSRPGQPLLAPNRTSSLRVQRGALQVVAADGDKKVVVKKKVPSPVKRAMLAEERRLYNRSRKSACATRIKKVIKLATALTATPVQAEEDVKPLELLVSEAYKEIDKAVTKGVLHINNGARKKARVARYKRQVLMAAGLFKPATTHPEHAKYVRLNTKKVVENPVKKAVASKAVKKK